MKSTKKHANAKHANAKKASKGPKTRLKRPFGDLPMVQVRMTNGGPQGVPPKSKKTPEQLDDEIAAALAGPPPLTSTVTILTVTHLFRTSGQLSISPVVAEDPGVSRTRSYGRC